MDYRGITLRSLSQILSLNFIDGDVLFLSSNVRSSVPGGSGNWNDQHFVVGPQTMKEIETWLEDHPEKDYDIYFCPLPFKETTKRKKDKVRSSKLLWSDLDDVTPEQIEKLEPTLLWESSPGSFQGLWALSDVELSPEGAENLNKKLTYFIGGDTSGWDLTQVLRVPGTINHKYAELPRVSNFKKSKAYTLAEIEEKLKDVQVEDKKISLGGKVDITGWRKLDPHGVYKKYEKRLSLTTRNLVKATPGVVSLGHRSENLWKMYFGLIEAGMGIREMASQIHATNWNKWVGFKNEEDNISREITRAYEAAGIVPPKEQDPDNYDYTQLELEPQKGRSTRKLLDISPDEPEGNSIVEIPGLDVTPEIIDIGGGDFSQAIPETYRQTLKLQMNYPETHFVTRYVEHSKQLSDSYPEYHHGAAITLLSIAIGRKAVIVFGSGTVFPNIWAFLVGNSTISRKSTAVNQAKDIASELFGMVALPQSFSPESFIEILSNTPQGWLFKDEVASLLAGMKKNYMGEIRDIFCEVYDNKGFVRKLRSSAKKVATEFNVQDPYMVQYVATTPGSLAENSQALDLTSGWLLRFMFYYPTYQKEWKPLTEMTKDQAQTLLKLKNTLKDLGEFFWNLNSPLIFTFSDEANKFFVNWQRVEEIAMGKKNDEVEAGAYGRLSVYAVKLAMVYRIGRAEFLAQAQEAVSKKGKISIDIEEIKWACNEVEHYFMPTVKQVYELIALNEGRNNQKKIIHMLNSHEGFMRRSELIRKLRCKLRDFNDDIASLVESGEIGERITKTGKGATDTVYIKLRESEE